MDGLPKLTGDMLDDIDVLDLVSQVDAGQIGKVPALFRAVFGEDGYRAIKAALAVDGKTKASDMLAWFRGQAAAKN